MHFTFRLLIVLDKLIFLLDYIFRLFISLLDILVNDGDRSIRRMTIRRIQFVA